MGFDEGKQHYFMVTGKAYNLVVVGIKKNY